MLIKKIINKICNLDKVAELKSEMHNQEKDIRCYQKANMALKDEIKRLTAEVSQYTDCQMGPWCDDCKHLKYATLPNEQQMVKTHIIVLLMFMTYQKKFIILSIVANTHMNCVKNGRRNKFES